MKVTFTPEMIAECKRIAAVRLTSHPPDQHRDAATKAKDVALGVIGEYVVARLLGQSVFDRWMATGAEYKSREPADVGRGIQVKTVDRAGSNLLVPQYESHPDQVYVLVYWDGQVAHVRGWAFGYDVQQPEFWVTTNSNGPLRPWRYHWLFPAGDLFSWSTLPQEFV